MRYPWLDEFLLQKPGVTKDFKEEWNWIRYQIGGKMFTAVCLGEDNEPYYITLKLEPAEGDFLRSKYKDIIPGYYMNKVHWNSVQADGEVPEELLKDLLEKSYQLVFQSLSKKKQKEILEGAAGEELTCCGTVCKQCGCYGTMCKGCNESLGKVFHAPKGQACPIYECSVKQKGCRDCDCVPCDIWKKTKDPSLSDEEFEQNVRERVERLRKG